MTTWRKQFADRAEGDGPFIAVAPDEAVLDVEFDSGYGSAEGPDVLIWTESYVYFPCVYDGAEWLGRAPRDPRPEPQHHEGGE